MNQAMQPGRQRAVRQWVNALALGCVALAATSSLQAAANPPDLSGVWELPAGAVRTFDPAVKRSSEEKPPLNPVWAEAFGKTRERVAAGMRVWDPNINCLPPGMPRTMSASYPFEILVTPGRITLLAEYFNETRRIWMDGRPHPGPDDLEPTFSGHSIGHWEGDTLVIDTVGLRFETVIDLAMVPHSDQLHVVERVRRAKPDELEWAITLEDPVVLARPWTGIKRYVRSPEGSEIREYVCADGNKPDPYTPSPEDAKYLQPDPRLKTLP